MDYVKRTLVALAWGFMVLVFVPGVATADEPADGAQSVPEVDDFAKAEAAKRAPPGVVTTQAESMRHVTVNGGIWATGAPMTANSGHYSGVDPGTLVNDSLNEEDARLAIVFCQAEEGLIGPAPQMMVATWVWNPRTAVTDVILIWHPRGVVTVTDIIGTTVAMGGDPLGIQGMGFDTLGFGPESDYSGVTTVAKLVSFNPALDVPADLGFLMAPLDDYADRINDANTDELAHATAALDDSAHLRNLGFIMKPSEVTKTKWPTGTYALNAHPTANVATAANFHATATQPWSSACSGICATEEDPISDDPIQRDDVANLRENGFIMKPNEVTSVTKLPSVAATVLDCDAGAANDVGVSVSKWPLTDGGCVETDGNFDPGIGVPSRTLTGDRTTTRGPTELLFTV